MRYSGEIVWRTLTLLHLCLFYILHLYSAEHHKNEDYVPVTLTQWFSSSPEQKPPFRFLHKMFYNEHVTENKLIDCISLLSHKTSVQKPNKPY